MSRSVSKNSVSKDKKRESFPKWDLTDLYKSPKDPILKKDIENLETDTLSFEKKYKGNIESLDAASFESALKKYEAIQDSMGKLKGYAYLLFSTHTQDSSITRFFQEIEEKITDISSHLLFFTLEINALEEESLQEKLKGKAIFYKPWIRVVRLFKKHELSEELEKAFHDFSIPAAQSWVRLYDETLGHLVVSMGKEKLSVGNVIEKFSDPSEKVRKQAALAFAESLEEKKNTFSLVYNTLMKENAIENKWRDFEYAWDSRHLANQVTRQEVDALEQAVKSNYGRLSHRYYNLKAKLLGKGKLNYWDRNAPVFGKKGDKQYSWEESKKIVLDAYKGFSPIMAEIGKEFFDHNWIDVPPYKGKDSGAYSHPIVPSVHPYILLNFYGKARDVATLAHELGHGIHQVLAAPQGALMADTPLTLAETASVFGEMLTFQSLLQKASTKIQRQVLLSQKIEDMLNTVVRQIAFYSFEKRVHEKRQTQELGWEDFGKIWMETQKESLGDIFIFDPSYIAYWTYISHFIHSPFYVYAYAFGDCLVNALYCVYEEFPEGFAEKYIEFLKAGGTKTTQELLSPFGLDPKDPSFWNKGLQLLERFIDQFEEECRE